MSEHDPESSAEHYEVLSYDGQTTVLPEALPDGPRSKTRRFVAIGVAAVLVAAAGVGAVAVAGALGGGGTQPEAVVPASAVFYAELDLDPAATQKVDAYRFLRKFPALKDAFTADGGYGPAFGKLFDGSGIDYAKDVQPWLGKRFAVALVPGETSDDRGRVMVVLQTTDEADAKASLTRVLDHSNDDHLSLAVSNGYVVLATSLDFSIQLDPGQATDAELAQKLVDQAARGNLADQPAYQSAVEPFGDSVATVWADNKGLSDVTGAMTSGLGLQTGALGVAPGGTGNSVAVLRFDGDTLELIGSTTDSKSTIGSGGVPAVSTLPDSTLAAFGANDVGTLLKTAYGPVWDQLGVLGGSAMGAGSSMDGMDDVPAPKDWPALFGDQTVVALGPGTSEPEVGVHVVGGAGTVAAVLDLISKVPEQVYVDTSADGVTVASSQSWLDALGQGGSFGDSETFRDAVPDAASAGAVGFADIDGIVDHYGSGMSADDRANLGPLRAVGFSASSHDGTTSFRLRVLTD